MPQSTAILSSKPRQPRIRTSLAALALLTFAPLSLRAADPKDHPPMDTTAFTTDLYAQLASQPQGNLFFSPASIETVLAMTYAGAKGATAQQMAKTLHYTGTPDEINAAFAKLLGTLNHPAAVDAFDAKGELIKKPAYQLVVANALWAQQGYPFQPAFTQLVQKDYAAGLNAVDFSQSEKSRATINDWVAAQTTDKIKNLIAPGTLTPDTRLVLTNAIYFKSNWQEPFTKGRTQEGPFKTSDTESAKIPLMHLRHNFAYAENEELQLLDMPYKGDELSMIVLLPRKTGGLPALEKNLTADHLRQWFKGAKNQPVEVTFPKFTFTAEFSLAPTLQTLGMADAFNPDKADFSGMTTAEHLFISAVIHKAFVAVDEEGTEAAAATAVAMAASAMPRRPIEPKIFTADHPFIFLIRHNPTGEILFMGRLTDPQGAPQ